jgi:internalin A
MKSIIRFLLIALTFIGHVAPMFAQEVTIPDLGLDTAIRDTLNIPIGPLTEQDLLGLTNLNASSRNISNIAGLEAARNLVSLNLQINRLTTFSLPTTLTNLTVLDLSANSLTNCSFPGGPIRLTSLNLSQYLLASFNLAWNLTSLVF